MATIANEIRVFQQIANLAALRFPCSQMTDTAQNKALIGILVRSQMFRHDETLDIQKLRHQIQSGQWKSIPNDRHVQLILWCGSPKVEKILATIEKEVSPLNDTDTKHLAYVTLNYVWVIIAIIYARMHERYDLAGSLEYELNQGVLAGALSWYDQSSDERRGEMEKFSTLLTFLQRMKDLGVCIPTRETVNPVPVGVLYRIWEAITSST